MLICYTCFQNHITYILYVCPDLTGCYNFLFYIKKRIREPLHRAQKKTTIIGPKYALEFTIEALWFYSILEAGCAICIVYKFL